MNLGNCFGFFGPAAVECQTCGISRQCKAVLVSDGLSLVGALVQESIEQVAEKLEAGKIRKETHLLVAEMLKENALTGGTFADAPSTGGVLVVGPDIPTGDSGKTPTSTVTMASL